MDYRRRMGWDYGNKYQKRMHYSGLGMGGEGS